MKKGYVAMLLLGLTPKVVLALPQLQSCETTRSSALGWFIIELIGVVSLIVAIVDGISFGVRKIKSGRQVANLKTVAQKSQLPWVAIISLGIFAICLLGIGTIKEKKTLCTDVESDLFTNVQLPDQFTK